MNALNVIGILSKLGSPLKDGHRWQASHKIDGKQTPERPKVVEFDCGLKDGLPWMEFQFTEPDGPHKLYGTFSPSNHGETILFDGADVEDDDVVVSHRIRGIEIRGVLEYEFVVGGHTHRYRFDATIAKLI
jgi:hypothetical protein